MTSSDVVRPKILYLWNQWAKTFDLVYYSSWFGKVRFFRKLWPRANFLRSRSKVKVKVRDDPPWRNIRYALNIKSLWQLVPELWTIMWFWRHLWRHIDVQWRRTVKKSISLESADQDLWFDILLDRVAKSSIFWKTLTWTELFKVKVKGQGQGHIWRALSNSIIYI